MYGVLNVLSWWCCRTRALWTGKLEACLASESTWKARGDSYALYESSRAAEVDSYSVFGGDLFETYLGLAGDFLETLVPKKFQKSLGARRADFHSPGGSESSADHKRQSLGGSVL